MHCRDICEPTGDAQKLHDPAWMAARGRRAIVPGMWALSAASMLAWRNVEAARGIVAKFVNTLYVGDEVTLEATPHNGAIGLHATCRDHDALDTLKEGQYTHRSHLLETAPAIDVRDGKEIVIHPKERQRFLNAIDRGHAAGGLFYAIACSSAAQLASMPALVGRLYDEGLVPVYAGLEVAYGVLRNVGDEPLHYVVNASERHGLVGTTVACRQNGNEIFRMKATLRPMRLTDILKNARKA